MIFVVAGIICIDLKLSCCYCIAYHILCTQQTLCARAVKNGQNNRDKKGMRKLKRERDGEQQTNCTNIKDALCIECEQISNPPFMRLKFSGTRFTYKIFIEEKKRFK